MGRIRPRPSMTGAFGIVRPNGIRPGPPRVPERIVVREIGHVEAVPDGPDPYGGEDWTPRTRRSEGDAA